MAVDPNGSRTEYRYKDSPIGSLIQVVAEIREVVDANSTITNVNLTVVNANSAVTNANTNLVMVFSNITAALENLAGMTGSLRDQVKRNDNILTSISRLVIDADDMVQGLKRHWLLRSAFKEEKPAKTESKPTKGTGR